MTIALPDLRARLRLDTSEFDRSIRRTSRQLQRTGRNMSRVGTTLSRNLSLPLAAAGGASLKMSVQFEDSMSKIRGLVGASAEQTKAWGDDVLELAKKLPQGPKELADALYFVTSAGIATEDAMDVVEASARAAAAGLGDTATVADAVTSAVNAYGIKALSAKKATDILTAAVREGKGEADAIGAAIGRIIAPAEALGIEFHEVAAGMSAMTLLGLDADEAATALRAIFSTIIKPAKQTREKLREIGTSSTELRKAVKEKGLLAALIDLRERIGNNQDAMGKLFPNVRALNGFMQLTGKNAKQNVELFDDLTKSTGATDKAYKEMSKTTGFKLKNALSSLHVAAIKLGDVLAPIATKIAGYLSRVADGFSGLSPGARRAIITAGALTIALGPLARVLGGVIGTMGRLITTVPLLGKALMFLSLNPVGIAITALGAAVAALAIAWRRSDKFRDAVKRLGEALRPVGDYMLDVFTELGPLVKRGLSAAEPALKLMVEGMTQAAEATAFLVEKLAKLLEKLKALPGAGVAGKALSFVLKQLLLGPTANIQGRAHGGSVTASQPYIVGERGSELFIPDVSGHIVSNADLRRLSAGGGPVTINAPITIHGVKQGDAAGISRSVDRSLRRVIREELDAHDAHAANLRRMNRR